MTIWKKALSAALSAALIASLTATAAFATKGLAGESDQTDVLDCSLAAYVGTDACTQVADGISTVTLVGDDDGGSAAYSTYITASGASIISVGATASWVLVGGIVTAPASADLNDATDTMVLRAPAAPGSAVVSVYQIATATGIATLEGTLTITFTATSGLNVSEANSTVKFVASTDLCSGTALAANVADKATNPAAKLCVILKDGNGSAVTTGATVAVTITPVGLAIAALSDGTDATAGTAQAASTAVNTVAGSYAFGIGGSNLAGTATIGISVTQGATTVTFAPKTFVFTGPLASLTVTQTKFAVVKGTAVAAAYPIANVVGKDAAGNVLACDTTWTATSGTTTIIANANLDVVADSPAAGDCNVQIISGPTPATAGSTAITVKNAGATISAAAFTFYVSDVAATVTVTFSAATIVPGGSATLTVTAKDAGGRPVADAASPGTPLVSSGAATAWSALLNGMATATYLAPFNTGTVTALTTIGGITGSGSASVSAPAPLPGTGTNASALGVTTAGPFSTTTKVAALGKYQTFKISYGAGAAGQTVGILVATKNSAGVWSGFTRVTGRVADSAGNVYYYWRSSAASWISVRGDLSGSLSNAVQGRWR